MNLLTRRCQAASSGGGAPSAPSSNSAVTTMDEYREAQRQKWLVAQTEKQGSSVSSGAAASSAAAPGQTGGAAGSSSSNAPAASSSSSAPLSSSAAAGDASAAQRGEPLVARRVHILPVETDPVERGNDKGRLELLAPELRRKREAQEIIKTGGYMRVSGHDFIVVEAEPDESLLAKDTDYYVDGEPIKRFGKVHLVCLWDFESGSSARDSNELFSEYVSPYFRSKLDSGEDMAGIIHVNKVIKIFDRDFQVMAAEPATDLGIMDANTMVFVDWDGTPEFEKIHIVPFQDTLPNAYEFDVFNDYLKPYLTRNKHLRLSVNDQFTYQGVQFKVVCTVPERQSGRIGRNTTVYCEGVLHPSLRNLLPAELLEQLSHLPPGLQMLLLNTEALAGGYEERLIEVQEMLSRRRGLNNETIDRVEKFRWDDQNVPPDGQTQCMVCLCDFSSGEEVRRLPCTHVFHASCIDEWLRRCTDCPICKANVDRAVRQY